MSRLFDDGSSEYLTNANAVLTAYPLTMAAWVYSDDAAVIQTVMGIYDTGAGDWARLALHTAGPSVRAQGAGGGGANTSTFWGANAWHHVCGTFVGAGANDVTAYLDAGGAGTGDDNGATPGNWDTTEIGVLNNSGARSQYMSGRIAEPAFWNVALTVVEIWQLAQGKPPWEIHRANLTGLWLPFGDRTNRDFSGRGYHMTAVNTPSFAADPPEVVRLWRA